MMRHHTGLYFRTHKYLTIPFFLQSDTLICQLWMLLNIHLVQRFSKGTERINIFKSADRSHQLCCVLSCYVFSNACSNFTEIVDFFDLLSSLKIWFIGNLLLQLYFYPFLVWLGNFILASQIPEGEFNLK